MGIDTRVGVSVEAVTLTDLDLDGIGTSGEVRVRLDIPLNGVVSGGLSVLNLLITCKFILAWCMNDKCNGVRWRV